MEECYQFRTRKIPKQNIVYRLINREIFGTKRQATSQVIRLFYLNIFPNFTVVNVEKPPCFLRKFSPDGQYFIAFSADQTSLEVYQYKGCSAAAELLQKFDGEYVGNKISPESDFIRSNIFNKLFQLKYVINVAENNKQLNRECSLFTEDCKYVIVGSAAYIPEDIRPHFYEIYTNNEAVTPNQRLPLEDISLHLIDLEGGKLCDTLDFKVNKIYLSHNQGLYLYKDRLAVLSVQHQTIYIYLILDGLFVNIRMIGRFCYESDELITSAVYASTYTSQLRPYRETVINSLKHRLLVFLYKRAANISQKTNNPFALRKFYTHFDQFKELRLWKMQMLDENHLLLKYASEDVVTLKTTETNSQPSLFVVYNIISTEIIAVYENTSKDLLYLFENFTDHFRNAKLNCESQYTCSPSNNIYARSAVQRFKQTIISARYGGPTEATKRLLAQLPISAQSYSCTPYLDLSLFSYDDKWISPMERPKGCGEHPIRFYERHSGLLKFKMYAGILGRSVPNTVRRLVAFIFHPTDPFAISVQRTNSDYIVNFHLRNTSPL
ncbi:hypothetical protein PGB90_006779 [Kerria lacca]